MYTMIKNNYLKNWTHCKTINRSYRHQCKTNKALLHLLDSLQKVKITLSTTVLTKILSLLKIRFLNEAIALRRITTKGSISLNKFDRHACSMFKTHKYLEIFICIYNVRGEIDQISTNTFRYTMCSAPNVYMFVYTLIGAQIVPLTKFLDNS